jgi:hypothetical protein
MPFSGVILYRSPRRKERTGDPCSSSDPFGQYEDPKLGPVLALGRIWIGSCVPSKLPSGKNPSGGGVQWQLDCSKLAP